MLTSPKAVSPVSFSSFSLDVPDGMESEDIFKEIYECIVIHILTVINGWTKLLHIYF